MLPSRGAASTATGEETRSRKRAGAARRTCGWFSPPQSSKVALWCFSSSSVAGRGPCLAPSLWSSLRAERVLASVHRDGRRARDARGARASRVVLAAAVEQGRRACGALLLSSLVPSLRARRSLDPPARRRGRAHHERARGARDARRDARGVWEVRAPSALGARGLYFARRLVAWWSLCCPVASFRARLSLAPPRAGGVRTTRGRAVHVAHGATRAARGESERRAPSELAVRVRGRNGRPGLPPAPRALLLPSLRSPRPPAGEARAQRAGVRRTRRAVWRTRRAGALREVRFPLSRFAVRACSLSFSPLLSARRAAPSLPAEGARSHERARDARAI